jgi:hypothetical protein
MKKTKALVRSYPKVEIVKINKNGAPVGANYRLYINGVKVPYVKHFSSSVDARGVAQVCITMYADISTRSEKKTKKTK